MGLVTLGSKAVGSVVKIHVNGVLRDFIVVQHGKPGSMYDASCNGTWLLMKDCYESRQWHNSRYNDYANSDIHSYLNSTFLNLIDANIRAQIKQVKIPYRPNGGTDHTVYSGANGLSCKIFLLSFREAGFTKNIENYHSVDDGEKLAYFQESKVSAEKIAYLNGSAVDWHLRSPHCNNGVANWFCRADGAYSYWDVTNVRGVRPVCILPDNLYVSDDGSVSVNTAPGIPGSISYPTSINGGSNITVSWGAATDPQGNLAGYIVERSTNGGSSWTQIYQGGAQSTVNNVAFGTVSVMYRVKAYDTEGLQSGWRAGSNITVLNNLAPSAPNSITVPNTVLGGGVLTVSWPAASDSDGNLSGYELERSVNSGAWSQIYKGSARSYTDSITKGWLTVAYRVRAYDSYSAYSGYTTSPARTVNNNTAPTLAVSVPSGTNLGVKNEGFDITYTVEDADGDTVTVREYLDNVLQRSYTAVLGQSNAFQAVAAANYQRILNGPHTLAVSANDGKAESAPYTVSFTKKVTEASVTLSAPLEADDVITVMALNVAGSLPADAVLQVLVTNNAKDASPVWEDATASIKNRANYIFANKTAVNGFAFNFRLTVGRGAGDIGGYISSIGGAFE